MILKPLNSTILRTRGSISCMKAHEHMHTPESALALARTRGHSGVRGYHNGRYRKQESEGKPPPSLLNFAVAAATCLVASSVPVFCAAADAADGKTPNPSATAVRGSPGLPDAETPLLASECIRRLKTILDVVRGIYGIPQPQPGAPPPLPPLPSPVIHGAPRLMTPQVRLWNRAAFQTSGDNHDDNTELGYEVVLDAQYASTHSIYDANWISKSGKGSSSAGSESAGPAVSLTAALGLLARAYPKLAASISRGEGAGTAGIWQYRPRPNLLIVLRPTHSGQAVEISWKPCACDENHGDGKTASTPRQRNTLGLLGIDLEAIAMLYGAAAQDWSMSASQSAGTAATGKPEATPADTLDKLVEIARAVHSMSATAKPVVDPGAVPSAAAASASASSKSNGPRTVLRIIKPKGSASSSSGDKTTVDVDADEEEDKDEEAAAVSRGAGGIGSLFGSRGSGLDPKTQPLKVLESLGIKYYSKKSHVMEGIDWECLAGYEVRISRLAAAQLRARDWFSQSKHWLRADQILIAVLPSRPRRISAVTWRTTCCSRCNTQTCTRSLLRRRGRGPNPTRQVSGRLLPARSPESVDVGSIARLREASCCIDASGPCFRHRCVDANLRIPFHFSTGRRLCHHCTLPEPSTIATYPQM